MNNEIKTTIAALSTTNDMFELAVSIAKNTDIDTVESVVSALADMQLDLLQRAVEQSSSRAVERGRGF